MNEALFVQQGNSTDTEEIQVPHGYEPFENLYVCGNLLKNGVVPIAVDGHAVILVGRGEEPGSRVKIWLQVPSGNAWNLEVYPDQIDDTAYGVVELADSIWPESYALHFGHSLIMRVHYVDEGKAIIDYLNLTPFGLSIFGSEKSLQVGDQNLTSKTFDSIHTMVSVG